MAQLGRDPRRHGRPQPLYAVLERLLGPIGAGVLFAANYVAQDGVHFFTCEQTFQSSYQEERRVDLDAPPPHPPRRPLCLDAWHTKGGSLASLFIQRRQVAFTQIDKQNHPELRTAMEAVGKWALEQNPRHDQTTHWWPTQLGAAAEQAFYTVARSS